MITEKENGEVFEPGAEILLCGFPGLYGTLAILKEAREELEGRFIPPFLDNLAAASGELISGESMQAISGQRAGAPCFAQEIGEGGIFAGLWRLAAYGHCGFSVSLGAIALRQETIEICEFYHLNPYRLSSYGSWLVVTGRAEEFIRAAKAGAGELQERVCAANGRTGALREGVPAANGGTGVLQEGFPAANAGEGSAQGKFHVCRIGIVTAGCAKVIESRSGVQYLNRPEEDELYRRRNRRRENGT